MKKAVSLLLAILMSVGLFSGASFSVGAAEAAGTYFDYFYYEDFESFTTDMTGEEIKEKLGWKDWDLTVADLKIVETVYFREVNANVTVADSDKTALVGANVMSEGEWTIRNHRTVDVSKLKTIEKFANLDYPSMKTYTKRLLVVPQKANQDTSATLVSGMNCAGNGLFVDYDWIPDYYNTLEVTNPAKTARSYESDSYLGLRVSDANKAKSVLQAMQVNASMLYEVVQDGATERSAVTNAQWYSSADMGYGTLNLDKSASTYRTYSNGQDGSLFYATNGTNTANGLAFASRMKLTAADFSAFVSHKTQNSTSYQTTVWQSTSNARSKTFEDTADRLFSGSDSLNVALECHHSGVAFYLDNLIVANQNGSKAPVQITVNGENRWVCGGANVDVASLAPVGKQLVYADVNSETKLAGDMITLAQGMNITARSISIATLEGASVRLNTPTGMRWETALNKTDMVTLQGDENIASVEIGTLILPTDYIIGEATRAEFETLEYDTKYLDVKATVGAWYQENDTEFVFAGSIANIKPENYDRAFSGIGYIRVTLKNGKSVELYGGYSAENHSRTVQQIAAAALLDVKTTSDGEYQYQITSYYKLVDGAYQEAEYDSARYSCYTEEQIAVLKGFFPQ